MNLRKLVKDISLDDDRKCESIHSYIMKYKFCI